MLDPVGPKIGDHQFHSKFLRISRLNCYLYRLTLTKNRYRYSKLNYIRKTKADANNFDNHIFQNEFG